MKEVMLRALNMVSALQVQMVAMKTMCIYRINGTCWAYCQAQQYCRPEECGLEIVDSLAEGGSTWNATGS